MASGFVTARDGIYTILNNNVVGSTSGKLKVGFKYDFRRVDDTAGQGYPYFTVSPSSDANSIDHLGTMNSWSAYNLIVRVFDLYSNDETSETEFLTLTDLVVTTLIDNDNINLGGTVQFSLVKSIKMGYNDANQPTMRIAEIECVVKQMHNRTA